MNAPPQNLLTPDQNNPDKFMPPESKSNKYIRTRQSVIDDHWSNALNQMKRPSVMDRSGMDRKK